MNLGTLALREAFVHHFVLHLPLSLSDTDLQQVYVSSTGLQAAGAGFCLSREGLIYSRLGSITGC